MTAYLRKELLQKIHIRAVEHSLEVLKLGVLGEWGNGGMGEWRFWNVTQKGKYKNRFTLFLSMKPMME